MIKKLLLSIFLLLFIKISIAQVALLNNTTSTVTPFDFNINTANNNRFLIVAVSAEFNAVDQVTGITYGGRPLTQINQTSAISGGIHNYVTLYYLNATNILSRVGNSVAVTYSVGGANIRSQVISTVGLQHVNQADPIAQLRTNTTLSDNIITATPLMTGAPNSRMIAVVNHTNNANVFSTNYTLLHNVSAANHRHGFLHGLTPLVANYSPRFDATVVGRMAYAAVRINAAPAPGGRNTNLKSWHKTDAGNVQVAGTNVTGWLNEIPDGVSLSTVVSDPQLNPNTANFHPAVELDGNDYLYTTNVLGTNIMSANNNTMYVISRRYGGVVLAKWEHITDNRIGMEYQGQRMRFDFPSSANNITGTDLLNDRWVVAEGLTSATSHNIIIDGLIENTGTGGTADPTQLGSLSLGANPSGEFPVHADIAEVIFYNANQTVAVRRRVESYLAIKYGATLGNSATPINYVTGDETVIWTGSAEFQNNVTGIGRDDISALNQKQSRSTNADAIFTMGLGTIATSNVANPNNFAANKDFFVWGNNTLALAGQGVTDKGTTVNGEDIEIRLRRVWRGQETGTVGTLRIRVNLSQILGVNGVVGANELSNVRLLVDADGVFATGATSIAPAAFNSATGIAEFDHDFTAGTGFFFTIGSVDVSNAPLPVDLVNLSGKQHGEKNLLEWTTIYEKNNDYFEVEFMNKEGDWEKIGRVKGKGDHEGKSDYTFVHSNITSGTYYYRLKQVDYDGSVKYSNIISVEVNIDQLFSVYPNPFTSDLFCTVDASMYGDYSLSVTNLQGKVLIEQTLNINESTIQLPISSLQNGVYFIELIKRDSGWKYYHKIVKM